MLLALLPMLFLTSLHLSLELVAGTTVAKRDNDQDVLSMAV